MSRKFRFMGPFDKQHGKCCQAQLKSTLQHFCHIQWSFPGQLSWKKYLLLTCKILVLLVNTLDADEKYPLFNRENLTIPVRMELSEKEKTFSQFFAVFLKSRLNSNYFETKIDPHSFCISEFTDSENVVRYISKKSRFYRPFDKQHGTCARALLKFASQHFYHIHWSLPSQLSWEKSLLLTCKILLLFVNTLAADEHYPVFNRDSLTIPIQMKLSQKRKTLSNFFAGFLESSLNFEYSEKKDDPHKFYIFEIRDSDNVVR